MIEPRYLKAKWNGWNTVVGEIKDKKELEEWLQDGSLEEGDVVYEVKTVFQVVKLNDERLVISEKEGSASPTEAKK